MPEPPEVVSLKQELERNRLAASEWRGRWEHAEGRFNAVWNLAIDAAMKKAGGHLPYCEKPCRICQTHKDLGSLRRLDMAGYVPIKERLRGRMKELFDGSRFSSRDRGLYGMGLRDLFEAASSMLADGE